MGFDKKFGKGFEVDKYVGKVVDTSRGNQRRVKRVVNDNKVGLSILGGAVTTLAIGVGILGSVLVNKKKTNSYKEKIDELETENERLEAILVSMNDDYMNHLGINEEDLIPLDEEYPYFSSEELDELRDWEGISFEDISDSDSFDFDFEDEDEFEKERAESLERDGDIIAPPYEPNETIIFTEEEIAETLTEVAEEDSTEEEDKQEEGK